MPKDISAAEAGRRGGKVRASRMTPYERSLAARKAAKARAASLTPARRSEIARNAVLARWAKSKERGA